MDLRHIPTLLFLAFMDLVCFGGILSVVCLAFLLVDLLKGSGNSIALDLIGVVFIGEANGDLVNGVINGGFDGKGRSNE